jgi:2-polyprenyl-3-methyl-5-hydroxy-6-metoxy-1,4-benzoquinol methylase
VARARQRHGVYGTVRRGDIRELAHETPEGYGTVFANSVLEHVDGLEQVLSACVHILSPRRSTGYYGSARRHE